MSATYDATKIASDNAEVISAVRWLVQDTDTTAAEVSDEEIDALYDATDADDSQKLRNYDTAFAVAQALERKYRKLASYSSGKSSYQLADRAKSWAKVVDELAMERFSIRQNADSRTGGILSASRPSFDSGDIIDWGD